MVKLKTCGYEFNLSRVGSQFYLCLDENVLLVEKSLDDISQCVTELINELSMVRHIVKSLEVFKKMSLSDRRNAMALSCFTTPEEFTQLFQDRYDGADQLTEVGDGMECGKGVQCD